MGLVQPMKRCSPPRRAIRSSPGRKYRWYVLLSRISAPSDSRSRCVTPLTAPCVPTGMNAGVATSPCGVDIRPRRARASVWVTLKLKAVIFSRTDYNLFRCVDSPQRTQWTPWNTEVKRSYLDLLTFVSFVSFVATQRWKSEKASSRGDLRRPLRRTRGVARVCGSRVQESRPRLLSRGADPNREGRAMDAAGPCTADRP